MRRSSFLRSPAAVLAAFALTFTAGCDQQPTGIDALGADDAAFAGIGDTGITIGTQNEATPSTNEVNKQNGWAYVEWNSDDAGVGEAPLKFVSTRSFISCFEYRIDGEPPTQTPNYNGEITDGLWPYVCVNNREAALDLVAENYVDIRMVFGAEGDERFDWTRFYVMTGLSKDDCKDGGWQALGFTNQGRCIRFIETGKDSRESGIFGAVTWTSALGAEGLYTEFAVNAAIESGTVWFRGADGSTFIMSVECATVEGTEGWAGGTVTYADGSYTDRLGESTLFYAHDNGTVATPDELGAYSAMSCDKGFPGSGSIWRGGGTVTDGDLVVR